jgi:aryl-alcohol dehydrogenase-like predicted oxidoreductase
MSRTLGATGLPVSPLGLGLAALGRPAYINLGHADDVAGVTEVAALRERAFAVMDAAWAAGVRYFDAARSYGRAEAFLGDWLRQRGHAPIVGTKWGYTYTAGWRTDADTHEVKTLDLATLRRQLEESRTLLGDRIDLLQIHSATLDSGVFDDAEVMAELARLRDAGVAIGFTATGADQAATIYRALETGAFDTVQATWNLLDPSAGEALAAASAAGLGVIVKEALANGRLAGRERVPALERAAVEAATTPDALALAAVLVQPWSDVVLSGAATVTTLQSNLRALRLLESLELDLSAFAALREAPETYWRRRSELAWN